MSCPEVGENMRTGAMYSEELVTNHLIWDLHSRLEGWQLYTFMCVELKLERHDPVN